MTLQYTFVGFGLETKHGPAGNSFRDHLLVQRRYGPREGSATLIPNGDKSEPTSSGICFIL
ncbi:hypothetical protein SERLA73DRAFT_146892, partial [Serpula lacrymans var. lacrymans S7.3]